MTIDEAIIHAERMAGRCNAEERRTLAKWLKELRGEGEKARPHDPVNHPAYYEQGGMDCITIMETLFGTETVMHFCLCNAFKYLWRHKMKNGLEDIEKAAWYLNRYVTLANKSDSCYREEKEV